MQPNYAEEPPPPSIDLDGWRLAISEDRFRAFPLESLVAAIQDLGLNSDRTVINALVEHVSKSLMLMLRKFVGTHHRNRGDDIIEATHAQLIDAVLQPSSADGKGLRRAFIPRVKVRVLDAVRRASKLSDREKLTDNLADLSDSRHANSPDPQKEWVERLHVEHVLSRIVDENKRLAFRLHMEGIPLESKRSASIAAALGVSRKTAAEWIEEVQSQLTPIVGERI